MNIVVLVSFPDELVVLLDDVGRNEAHLDESVDGSLDQNQVNHFVVSVLSDLPENRLSQAVHDIVEALIPEQVQCSCGQSDGVVVPQIISILKNQ